MLRALWFIIKLTLLIALAVWVASHPGYFTIVWLDYTITAHIGAALIALLIIIALASYTGRIFAYMRDLPNIIKRYKYIRGSQKGVTELTRAYAMTAAGDSAKAERMIKRADNHLPGNFHRGLIWALKAHLAKMNGDFYGQRQALAHLAEMKDVGILGLQGIFQQALDAGDLDSARNILTRYAKRYKGQSWFMRACYEVALARRDWPELQEILEDRHFRKAMNKSEIRSDLVALYVLRADRAIEQNKTHLAITRLKKALRLDKSFIPAAMRLADIYLDMGKITATKALLQRSWDRQPHPDLVPYFQKVFETHKKTGARERLKYFEKLARRCPGNMQGDLALARVALEEEDWSRARRALESAEGKSPNSAVYYLWAEYEERANHDSLAYNSYMRKAAKSCPDKKWVCSKTGHIYERWHPIAPPHGSFNTIIWAIPQSLRFSHLKGQSIYNEMHPFVLPEKTGELILDRVNI